MKIDLHTHILPERWPSWTRRSGYAGWIELAHHRPGCAQMVQPTSADGSRPPRVFREIGSNCWDPGVRLAEMDAAGVSAQVLSTVPVMFSYWAKPGDANDLARLLNDHIAEVCRAGPRVNGTAFQAVIPGTAQSADVGAADTGRMPVPLTRFLGLGTLPMQDSARACRELERCVRELGLPGVQIGTHVNGANLDEPEIMEVFGAAERLGACVFVHPWDMIRFSSVEFAGQQRGFADRMERYWMPWLVGMPTDTAIAIMSVLFGGVLDRFPRLRLCFAHGGGSFPGTLGRIAHGFECRRDLFPAGARDPREYLARGGNEQIAKGQMANVCKGASSSGGIGIEPARFYVDSLVHDAEALRLIVKMFGVERVAIGSDYPFPLGEDRPGTMVEGMRGELGEDAAEHVLWRSAATFLGLSL